MDTANSSEDSKIMLASYGKACLAGIEMQRISRTLHVALEIFEIDASISFASIDDIEDGNKEDGHDGEANEDDSEDDDSEEDDSGEDTEEQQEGREDSDSSQESE